MVESGILWRRRQNLLGQSVLLGLGRICAEDWEAASYSVN